MNFKNGSARSRPRARADYEPSEKNVPILGLEPISPALIEQAPPEWVTGPAWREILTQSGQTPEEYWYAVCELGRMQHEAKAAIPSTVLMKALAGKPIGLLACANLVFWHSALQEAHLSPLTRVVYADLAMRDNGKDGGKHAFAGIRKIAADCDISAPRVLEAIKELEAAGLIEVRRTNRKRSQYRVRTLEEWHAGPHRRSRAAGAAVRDCTPGAA